MTFRIEKSSSDRGTLVLLAGRLRPEHIDEVEALLEASEGEITIDIGDLTLIGAEGVHFLNTCRRKGMQIVNATPYISGWMKRERTQTD